MKEQGKESSCEKRAYSCTRSWHLAVANKVEMLWRNRVVVGSGWEAIDETLVEEGVGKGRKAAKPVTLTGRSVLAGDLAEKHLEHKGHCPLS
jgi:hypothetical protein